MYENNNYPQELSGEILQRLTAIEQHLKIGAQAKDDLMTLKECCQFLGLEKATIYSKCSRRELPFSKQGKRLYFSREELTKFIRSNTRLTASEVKAQVIKNAASAMNGGNGYE